MSGGTRSGSKHFLTSADIVIQAGGIHPLLNRAKHATSRTELVIAPVQLHRRNLKRRLSRANLPLDTFEFISQPAIAHEILNQVNIDSSVLDRVDRLSLLAKMLADGGKPTEKFELILGDKPTQSVKRVEQVRNEITDVTNYMAERYRAIRRTAKELPDPAGADLLDALKGVIAIEQEFRRRDDRSPTEKDIVRRATRQIAESEGRVWAFTYPNIEQVTVVGLSSIDATTLDLVTAVARYTPVQVQINLRQATAPYLIDRLDQAIVESLTEPFIP